MSKGKKGAKLKIIAATSMVVFSLASAFAGSIAWFDVRSSFDNGADDMAISVVSNLESIDIYQCDSGDATVEGYTFNSTPIQQIAIDHWEGSNPIFKTKKKGDANWTDLNSAAAIDMNPDIEVNSTTAPDPFSPLSPYHPLLFVITFGEVQNPSTNPIRVRAETNKGFLTPAKTPTNADARLETLASSGNPMSNFIQTYAKGYDANTAVPFSYTPSALADSSMQKGSFATLNGSNPPVFNSNPTLFEENTNSIKKIGMIFEYNAAVIEYIYFYYLGNPILDNVITATCDWRLWI